MIAELLTAVAVAALAVIAAAEALPNTRLARSVNLAFSKRPQSIGDLDRRDVLTVEELALVEKYVPRLRSVVIMCHRVDQPNPSLAKAVLDNFQQGAEYTFFVSPGGAHDKDLADYRDWFSHIFAVADKAAPTAGENSTIRSRTFEDVFSIKRLPLEWNNVPYVFYSFENDNGNLSTIAFRGTEMGVGISPWYDRMPPVAARALIDLASAASAEFSPAIGGVEVDVEEGIPDTKIVDIKTRQGVVGS
jgi:hypothetical protein